jgi:hypothetical protein
MKYLVTFTAILCVVFLSCGMSKNNIVKSDEIDKTFAKKDIIKMNFVSGNCRVSKSTDDLIHVKVISEINPQVNFNALIDEYENSLELKEQFLGSTKGNVNWILSIPNGVKIDFISASGNFNIENLKTELKVSVASGNIDITNSEGKFKISTASGNITSKSSNGNFKLTTASGNLNVNNSEGSFKLSSASGNIVMENTKGEMKLNTASGIINVTDITTTEKCSFNSASGDVNVKLASSPKNDLSLNTASGDAVLDYNGNSISGYFKFSVMKNHGKIIVPFTLDNEKEIINSEDENRLVRTARIDSDNPIIKISTSTGSVELKK